ncbi:MAG TPA: ABC transporter permease [Ktedonobacterales bacterium]
MSVRRMLALALRIVRQVVHDRRTLAFLFIVPLFVMTILNFVLSSSGGKLTLGVVPPDTASGSVITGQVTQGLAGQRGVRVEVIARADVERALRKGEVDGALIFPAAYQPGSPATLTLRLEGSNPGAASALRSVVTQLVARLQANGSPGLSLGASSPSNLDVTYLHGGPQYTQTDALAPLLVGVFAFFFVFLLTSVAFLRERSQGTIERLMVSPLSKTELVLGYVVGFTLFALVQSLIILLFVIYVLRVHYTGNLGLLFLVTVALTVGGVNMGIFASAFARNELQVIQFIPLLIVPQILLGGLFFPVATLPVVLKQLAYVFPLTYANIALKGVMLKGDGLAVIWPDLIFLLAFAALMIVGASLSLRQERLA